MIFSRICLYYSLVFKFVQMPGKLNLTEGAQLLDAALPDINRNQSSNSSSQLESAPEPGGNDDNSDRCF